jgi:hypothetical protein
MSFTPSRTQLVGLLLLLAALVALALGRAWAGIEQP